MKTNRSADIAVRRDAETRSVPEEKVAVGNRALLRTGMAARGEEAAEGGCARSPEPALKNEFGFWELTWNGESAVLRCEPGAAYVAWLLENRPAEPITALDLASRIREWVCPCFGSTDVFHPDEAAATLFWLRKQLELEALVDSEDTLDPVKEEALRELEAIYAWQRNHPERVNRDAEAAARMVEKAIQDFFEHLLSARTLRGEPHRLARAFADYIGQHLVGPRGVGGWAFEI